MMLGTFCLRLACGLGLALLVLSPTQVNPRFYRVQFLTVLGLLALAGVAWRETAGMWQWAALAVAMAMAFLGSVVWSLDGAPGGKTVMALTAVALLATVTSACLAPEPTTMGVAP